MVRGLVMGIVVACTALANVRSACAQETSAAVGVGITRGTVPPEFRRDVAGVDVGIAVKGGVVFPQFSEGVDNRTSWQAGISVGGRRGGVVGVQGELNLLHKRVADRVDPDIHVAVDYLQIPVLVRLQSRSHSASGVQVYGLAGPSIDVKLRESYRGIKISGSDGVNTFDLSGVIGAGIELGTFSMEGRYSRGFRQINRGSPDSTFKAHSFAVLFGLRLS